MLKICESLFILAVDDDEGDIVKSVVSALESALASAVLAELALLNRIELVEQRIVVSDQASTAHAILDKALFDILDTTNPRKLKYWLNTLIYNKIFAEIGHHLVKQGLLIRKKKRLHLVILNNEDSDKYVSIKFTLKHRLREIVLSGQQPDPTEKILLAFLFHGKLLKLVFTIDERRAAQKRVKNWFENGEEENQMGELLTKILYAAYD